jgi:hypothetical protein
LRARTIPRTCQVAGEWRNEEVDFGFRVLWFDGEVGSAQAGEQWPTNVCKNSPGLANYPRGELTVGAREIQRALGSSSPARSTHSDALQVNLLNGATVARRPDPLIGRDATANLRLATQHWL